MEKNDSGLDSYDLKLYQDHYECGGWHLDRAGLEFTCEFKECSTVIIQNDRFICFDNCEEEFNYCIKHGLEELLRYKRELKKFELMVKKVSSRNF